MGLLNIPFQRNNMWPVQHDDDDDDDWPQYQRDCLQLKGWEHITNRCWIIGRFFILLRFVQIFVRELQFGLKTLSGIFSPFFFLRNSVCKKTAKTLTLHERVCKLHYPVHLHSIKLQFTCKKIQTNLSKIQKLPIIHHTVLKLVSVVSLATFVVC